MNKVKVGFFSFTEITDPAEHRAYNEWHQLDHMPEQYPLPGLAFGQRWVSTPACRAARAVDGALLAPVHYVTLYLMSEPVEATLDEFLALGASLREAGRFHQQRRALLSGPFAVASVAASPRVLISAEAVPYRPNLGAYLLVEDLAADGDDADRTPDRTALLALPGVAGVWTFVSDQERRRTWRPGSRRITVCFLDSHPLTVAPAIEEVIIGPGAAGASVIHAGPLETVVPWHWDWFDAPDD